MHRSGLLLTLVFAGLAIVGALMPHPFNMSPVGALALFSGFFLARRWIWLVPVAAMAGAWFVAGSYDLTIMAFVLLGLMLGPLTGRLAFSKGLSWGPLYGGITVAAIGFYLVSNFGLWISGLYYPMTVAGLSECMIKGLPYLARSLIGDAIYGSLIMTVGLIHARRSGGSVPLGASIP